MNIEQQTEKALEYLQQTDEPHARAKALLGALQEQRKTVKAAEFISAMKTGVSNALAEQLAYSSENYKEIISKIEQADFEYNLMNNKRKRAEMTIELYRTYSANVRRGNV